MVSKHLPGSSTKNFSWRKDPHRLHRSISNGFHNGLRPVPRETWRQRSALNDPNVELIPLNFFLYSKAGIGEDYVLADTLVEFALNRPSDDQFVKLAVFAFHLANSGTWKNSDWPDGKVAGWANAFIKGTAYRNGDWLESAFQKSFLLNHIKENVTATSGTHTKMCNNYWFMLQQSGILTETKQSRVTSPWGLAAPQLSWDRKIFDGTLNPASSQEQYEALFANDEIHKLMRLDETQGKAVAKAAFREYANSSRLSHRLDQITDLKPRLLAAS